MKFNALAIAITVSAVLASPLALADRIHARNSFTTD